jgi:hypothetical protein
VLGGGFPGPAFRSAHFFSACGAVATLAAIGILDGGLCERRCATLVLVDETDRKVAGQSMPKTNPNEYQARVFISCGQDKDNEAERTMTAQVSKWFEDEDYIPYLATEIQTHEELNLQIIDALKSCDYFLFINLPRGEPFSSKVGSATRRGSLYSNQELAVAYAFGFKKMILIAHKDVIEEGVSKFITVNTPKFDAFEEVLGIVRGAVAKSGWESTFSRHLQLGDLSVDAPRVYWDHTGARNLRISHVKIINNRPDIGAVECTARLVEIEEVGSAKQKSPDQSHASTRLFSIHLAEIGRIR